MVFNNCNRKLYFQDIIIKNTNNFFDDFVKLFPNECNNIHANIFETMLKIFIDKNNDLIKDKNYVMDLINKNENVINFVDKNYYKFNKENYIFNNSKNLQILIDNIKNAENEFELKKNNNENKLEENKENELINLKEDDNLEFEEFINDFLDIFLKKNNPKKKRFLIQNGIPINEKLIENQNIKYLNNFIFGKNEINKIEISEMNFIEIPKEITINSLIKFFDDCDLGTLVFPLYVFKAIKSQNEEDKKKLNNYYSILLNAYLSLENTKNVDNLICEYTNQFKNSFEDMISKLKKKDLNQTF